TFADPLPQKALVRLALLSRDLPSGFQLRRRETNRELAKHTPRANTRSQRWIHLPLDEFQFLQLRLRRRVPPGLIGSFVLAAVMQRHLAGLQAVRRDELEAPRGLQALK